MDDLGYLLRMYDMNGNRRVTFDEFRYQIAVRANQY